jgi:hypothetical protein
MTTKRAKKGRSIDDLIADELEQDEAKAADSSTAATMTENEAAWSEEDSAAATPTSLSGLVSAVLRQQGLNPEDVEHSERLRAAQIARRIRERHSESELRKRGLIAEQSYRTVTFRLPQDRYDRLFKIVERKRGGLTMQRIGVEALELWMKKKGLDF